MIISLITCANNLNIGNEFINQGTKILIDYLFPEAEINIYESYDTINENNISYNKVFENEINKSDLIFIACGSLISKWGFNAIRSFNDLKPLKIFIGIGMFFYNQEEMDFCKEFEQMTNTLIVTRDNQTFNSFTNKNNNIINGIDMAFFLSDKFKKIETEKYAVVNLDSIGDNISAILLCIEYLKNNFNKIFIVENTVTRYRDIPEIRENYIYISHWYELYKLYQNSSMNVTNRIHTVVCSLQNDVSFRFMWNFIHVTERKNLFERVGLNLNRNKIYDSQNFKIKLEEEKIKFRLELKDKLYNFNLDNKI